MFEWSALTAEPLMVTSRREGTSTVISTLVGVIDAGQGEYVCDGANDVAPNDGPSTAMRADHSTITRRSDRTTSPVPAGTDPDSPLPSRPRHCRLTSKQRIDGIRLGGFSSTGVSDPGALATLTH